MKTRKNIKCKSKKKYLIKNARTFKKQTNKYMSKRTHIYVGGSKKNISGGNRIMPNRITNTNIISLVANYISKPNLFTNNPIASWDVSNVTNMSKLFMNYSKFNENISNWVVSKVKKMDCMFYGCTEFNQVLSNWDVSNVKDMSYMFFSCTQFNKNLSTWNVSNVKNMIYMFFSCTQFNKNLSTWNVNNVKDMSHMFFGCTQFNQDLSKWNVSNVENMYGMFYECKSFIGTGLNIWGDKVPKVINMSYMFYGCTQFNQDLSKWIVSNVKDMSYMFYGCTQFNQDLSNWDVSNVINMSYMFYGCTEMEEKFKIKLDLFYPNIKLDDEKSLSLQPLSQVQELLNNITKYIINLISSNKIEENTGADLEAVSKAALIRFNTYVKYLLTYFRDKTETESTTDEPIEKPTEELTEETINKLFTKLLTINYNAYTDNNKNLLDLPKLDNHIYNLLDLHGGIPDNKQQNIFFQLPKNVTIIFLTRLSYLVCSKLEPICNIITGVQPLIEKYIKLLNNKDININGIEKTDEMINLLSIFKDAVFYYGEQYCINLELSKSTKADQLRGMGMYNSKSGCKVYDSEANYNISLKNLLKTDEYKDINIKHTIILTSCRSLSIKNMRYSNILKFYEEIVQVINNTNNTNNIIIIENDTKINKNTSIVNTRYPFEQPSHLSQYYNTNKSKNLKTDDTPLFPNLSQQNISENTILIIKNSKTGKDDIITIEDIKTEYKKKLDTGEQPNYDDAFEYLNNTIPLPNKILTFSDYTVTIRLHKQYQRIIELIFNTDDIKKEEGILTIMDTVHLRIKIQDYKANPDSFTDKPIGSWDVSRVTDMSNIFRYYTNFDEDLSNWNVSNVIKMSEMFNGCTKFTGIGLDMWATKVHNVKDMRFMFYGCTQFIQDLSNWNVSNVEKMDGMFYDCRSFIGTGLDKWGDKVLNVKYMSSMFYGCTKFNQDLSAWKISKDTVITDIFNDSGFSNKKAQEYMPQFVDTLNSSFA